SMNCGIAAWCETLAPCGLSRRRQILSTGLHFLLSLPCDFAGIPSGTIGRQSPPLADGVSISLNSRNSTGFLHELNRHRASHMAGLLWLEMLAIEALSINTWELRRGTMPHVFKDQ